MAITADNLSLRHESRAAMVMEDIARREADNQVEDRTPLVPCRARRQVVAVIGASHKTAAIIVRPQAVDRTEVIPEADRMEILLVAADIHPPDMTAITDRFSPRFIPHLTHRQEASEGASCPPRRVALGNRFRKM